MKGGWVKGPKKPKTPAEQIEGILDHAESFLEAGDAGRAVMLCDEALSIDPDHAGALFVRGDGLRVMGLLEQSKHCFYRAALAQPKHASSWASYALSAFEMLDLVDAKRATQRALREDPINAQAWWVRSLIRERFGDIQGADRALQHASWLDPSAYPLPPQLTDEQIYGKVSDCLSRMPEAIRKYIANVAVTLEDVPSEKTLEQYDPPVTPTQILAFFSGPRLIGGSDGSQSWCQLPASLVIFRRNFMRYAINHEALMEELELTLLHEIGHFLGMDSDTLRRTVKESG